MANISQLESDTINFLRFPLILGVLFIHSNFDQIVEITEYNFFYHFYFLFSQILARLAVPVFFFISGYLFFIKPEYNLGTWVKKLHKRVYTLLFPYMIWNTIYIVLSWLGQQFLPQYSSGNNKLINDYQITDFLSCFWSRTGIGGSPIDYPLWFIRDLMIVIIFSYVILYSIKKLKYAFIFTLCIFWFMEIGFVPDGLKSAFFFFSSGAYFSINQLNFLEKIKPIMRLSTFTYIPTIIILLIYSISQPEWYIYLHKFGILVGIISLFGFAQYWLKRHKLNTNCSFISDSTFFIFAYHAFPLAQIIKLSCKYSQPFSELSLTFVYILSPCITFGLGLIIYYALKKYFPKLSILLTGGR